MMMAFLKMPCRYTIRIFPRLLLLAFLMSIISGCCCDREDYCPTSAVLYISVADEYASGSSDDDLLKVENVVVYFFDADLRLQRVVKLTHEELESRTPIEVTIYKGKHPQVVVWGNLNGAEEVLELPRGFPLSDARISMINEGGFALPVDPLYYGGKRLTDENVQEVVINPLVGRLFITVRGIENADSDADDYYFTAESRYSEYDFNGQPQKGDALIEMAAEWKAYRQEDILVNDPVSLISYPENSDDDRSMIIKLYKRMPGGDVLIASTDKDDEGNKIVIHSGKNTNVMFDFTDKTDLKVYLKLTPWGYIYQWAWW